MKLKEIVNDIGLVMKWNNMLNSDISFYMKKNFAYLLENQVKQNKRKSFNKL